MKAVSNRRTIPLRSFYFFLDEGGIFLPPPALAVVTDAGLFDFDDAAAFGDDRFEDMTNLFPFARWATQGCDARRNTRQSRTLCETSRLSYGVGGSVGQLSLAKTPVDAEWRSGVNTTARGALNASAKKILSSQTEAIGMCRFSFAGSNRDSAADHGVSGLTRLQASTTESGIQLTAGTRPYATSRRFGLRLGGRG